MKNQKYAIVGMGVSGQAGYKLLKTLGFSEDRLTTFDTRQGVAKYFEPEKMLTEFGPDILVVSPGVPLTTDFIAAFTGEVTNELRLSLDHLADETVFGVTGSQGKSTVIALLEAALEASGRSHFVGGNYGTPLASYVNDVLTRDRQPAEIVCLELSSYQLENCSGLELEYSAITSFSENHLDRYPDVESYFATKLKILDHTKKLTFCNSRSPQLKKFVSDRGGSAKIEWLEPSSSQMALLGDFNRQNFALAERLLECMHLPTAARIAMQAFTGLAHRLENVARIDDVTYINDSKATTIDAVLAATFSILPQATGRLILLIGGRDKNLPWHDLLPLTTNDKVLPVCFGESGLIAADVWRDSAVKPAPAKNLAEAIASAKRMAKAGDVVLLSPGGSSLDEFGGFAERGDCFKKLVQQQA